jgi:hypothetical protein
MPSYDSRELLLDQIGSGSLIVDGILNAWNLTPAHGDGSTRVVLHF